MSGEWRNSKCYLELRAALRKAVEQELFTEMNARGLTRFIEHLIQENNGENAALRDRVQSGVAAKMFPRARGRNH